MKDQFLILSSISLSMLDLFLISASIVRSECKFVLVMYIKFMSLLIYLLLKEFLEIYF